jgi:hypothetical protein
VRQRPRFPTHGGFDSLNVGTSELIAGCARDDDAAPDPGRASTLWISQEVGHASRLAFLPTISSPSRGVITGRNTMYIGLGTILFIVLIFLLFRAMSGRRV